MFWKNKMEPLGGMPIKEAIQNYWENIQIRQEKDHPQLWNPPCELCGHRGTFVLAWLPVKECHKCQIKKET